MIRKKRKTEEIVIDLTGPDGNVFVLIAYAHKFSRQLADLWKEEMLENREMNNRLQELGLNGDSSLPESLEDKIVGEMILGDYENAVEVFDRYFGSFVILER